MSQEWKVAKSSNLMKLVLRFIKMFWEKAEQKNFWPECPFEGKIGDISFVQALKANNSFLWQSNVKKRSLV